MYTSNKPRNTGDNVHVPTIAEINVSRLGIQSGDPAEYLRFAYGVNPNRTIKLLKVQGIDSNGLDFDEVVENESFKFGSFLRNFKTTNTELKKAVNSGFLKIF
jgi:hypothetical protein